MFLRALKIQVLHIHICLSAFADLILHIVHEEPQHDEIHNF